MRKIFCAICLLVFCSLLVANESLWLVTDYWLTGYEAADFSKDGIVNLKDFAMTGAYGCDEYGLDNYGN